jgi:hypothetical protein
MADLMISLLFMNFNPCFNGIISSIVLLSHITITAMWNRVSAYSALLRELEALEFRRILSLLAVRALGYSGAKGSPLSRSDSLLCK